MKLFAIENLLNWLLVFVPVAIVLELTHASASLVFLASCLAIVPLAGLMGKATEHLAEKVGEGVGGLLNATFGNAAELIIAIVALSKGLTDVVKASITGSIIGNILLVFGLSALFHDIGLPEAFQDEDESNMSLGQIEEQANITRGMLDIPPFASAGKADSFFDLFVNIQVNDQVLHPAQQLHMVSVITHKPPGTVEWE